MGSWTMLYPDNQLSLIFLPNVSFSAQHALVAFMGFDLASILLRRFTFDHYVGEQEKRGRDIIGS